MSEFTYTLPDSKAYLNAVTRLISKVEGLGHVARVLERSTCTVDAPGAYGSRWRARRATVYLYVPFEDLDMFEDQTLKSVLIGICDRVMPKDAGFDVMGLEVVPRLDSVSDQPAATSSLGDKKGGAANDSGTANVSHAVVTSEGVVHEPETEAPKVFISYTWDSSAHVERVLNLADRLRTLGIDASIDQYIESPSEGWPRWMVNQVEWADYVLVICSETYDRRFRGQEQPGKGLGGVWEGLVITQDIYDASANNLKFIPCFFEPSSKASMPIVLRSVTHYNLGSEEDFQKLYRRLTGQPSTIKPALGAMLKLPVRGGLHSPAADTQTVLATGQGAAQMREVDLNLLKQLSHSFTGSSMRIFIENLEDSATVYTDQVTQFEIAIREFRSANKRFRDPSLEAAKTAFLDALARFLAVSGTTFFTIGPGRAKFYGGISEYQLLTSHAKSYPEDFKTFLKLARECSNSWDNLVQKAAELAPDFAWPD